MVGDTQRFECQVIGYPSPEVTWFKDDVDITKDPRYNIHLDQARGIIALTIQEVLPSDEGCYQCKAQNSEGYATTTAYLVVRGKSHVHRFLGRVQFLGCVQGMPQSRLLDDSATCFANLRPGRSSEATPRHHTFGIGGKNESVGL